MNLENQNRVLKKALEYLLETKARKDKYGKDSIYLQKRKIAWYKAEQTLVICKESKVIEVCEMVNENYCSLCNTDTCSNHPNNNYIIYQGVFLSPTPMALVPL